MEKKVLFDVTQGSVLGLILLNIFFKYLFLVINNVNFANYPDGNKQIFHAFLFKIRNFPPRAINIQRRKVELSIVLQRVKSFDIKQKKALNICLIICHQHKQDLGSTN